MISRERLNTLWIGERLGLVERACLRSVLRQGHRLALYCYRQPDGVPEGVEILDAADILPEDRIIRHQSGSAALFANFFRYELQRRGCGTWVDADIYLLGPLDLSRPYLFGFESKLHINNAVLRLPPSSPLLPPLLELLDEKKVPYWLPWREWAAARMRLHRTGRTGLSLMPWGSAGPKALTALARRYGLAHWALPEPVLYPVPYQRADWIRDPNIRLEDVISPETVSVHLWGSTIKAWQEAPAPPGSFLARLHDEGR